MVQLFFVYRIWKLSKKATMPIIITVITVTQCAFAIVEETHEWSKDSPDVDHLGWKDAIRQSDMRVVIAVVKHAWSSAFKDDSVVL